MDTTDDKKRQRAEATEHHLRETLHKRAHRLLSLLANRAPKFVAASEALMMYEAAAALCPEAVAAMTSRRAWGALGLCTICGLAPDEGGLDEVTGMCPPCSAEAQDIDQAMEGKDFTPENGV